MSRRTSAATQLLVVDVGNTRLRAGRFEATRLAEEWSCVYDGERPSWSVAWRQFLRQLAVQHGALPTEIASVAQRRAGVVCRALRELGHHPVHLVTSDDPWPFRSDIEQPQTVGIDRLANVAGLLSLGLRTAIAVDLGTAITVDVLDDGVFRGGLIMPGLTLQARALHEHTSHLPAIDVHRKAPVIGRNTPDAMLAGMTQMTLAGVAAAARRQARRLGAGTPILYTGGWAPRFRPVLRSAIHQPDLLFQGLRHRASVHR